jgi:hypothetical protein
MSRDVLNVFEIAFLESERKTHPLGEKFAVLGCHKIRTYEIHSRFYTVAVDTPYWIRI